MRRKLTTSERTNASETANLLADPPNTVRHTLHTLNDRDQKAIRDFHQHRQPGGDDSLDITVRRSDFRGNAAWEVGRQGPCLFFYLNNHLLIHLDRVDLEIKVLVLDEAVDSLCQDGFQITLAGSSTGVRRHHP